jgi:hypothetical protein
VRLRNKLEQEGFHSSLATSYSCDIPYYEEIVQARLRAVGCRNNVLLVDADTYARAIPGIGRLAPGAGRRYSVHPVRIAGAFHPKLLLQFGKEAGRALIGSANLSSSGLGSNRELMSEIICSNDPTPAQGLIARLFDYVRGYCDERLNSVSYHLKRIVLDTPWLADAPRTDEVRDLPDGGRIALVLGPDHGNSVQRIARLIAGDKVRRLVVAAPFWDRDLRALAELIDSFQPLRTILLVQPATVNLRWEALASLPASVGVRSLDDESDRYLHAKMFLIEGEEGDHLVTGSANCSVAALGLADRTPINAEVCVYRRMPKGTALTQLNLSQAVDGPSLSAEQLRELKWQPEPSAPGGAPHPGLIEARGRCVIWWPADGLMPTNSQIELLDAGSDPIASGRLPSDSGPPVTFDWGTPIPPTAILARVWLSDGHVTAPVLLHVQEELRRAAPGTTETRVSEILERIHIGESDYLDLLEPLERILFQPTKEARKSDGGGGSKHGPGVEASKQAEEQESQRLTYEEFLAGRRAVSTGEDGSLAVGDADIAILVDFLRRRFATADTDEPQIIETIEERTEGEEEGADQQEPTDEKAPDLTVENISRAQGQLSRLAASFLAWSEQARRDRSRLFGADDLAQIWGLLTLATYLTERPIPMVTGGTACVIPLIGPQDELCFTTLTRDVIGSLFCLGTPTLAQRLHVPAGADEIPDEFFGAFAACCWAISASIEAASQAANQLLRQDLEVAGYALYRESGIAAGKFEMAAVEKRLQRIHDFAELENKVAIHRVLRWHCWFQGLVRSSRPPEGWVPGHAAPAGVVEHGACVWAASIGPRYVRGVLGDIFHLNNPGGRGDAATYKVKAAYVTPLIPVTPSSMVCLG